MVIHRNEMKTEVREKMRDGNGSVELTYLVNTENEKHTRMLGEITLKSGCSIGNHSHENETEYFFIISGAGTVVDNGKEVQIKAGDSIITGNGASHSIRNSGTEPLIFHAVIITYDK